MTFDKALESHKQKMSERKNIRDFDREHKNEVLEKLRANSKEQSALNRIIRNRTRGEELQGNEFWLLQ